MLVCPVLQAQGIADSLADLSIEQLMKESVNTVTKKTTRQFDAPAAVSVLSHDDVERSGATTLADALRMVPGLHVAAVNSHLFSVSSRGFGGVFANKMLVLRDGRALYNPVFAGVYWELQQTMLEDLDRVEVIRGPGAAIWGANSMNGVINVVSRSARYTQGGLTYLGGGNVNETMVGGRYGGMIGEDTYYRIFASSQSSADYRTEDGRRAGDGWRTWHGGFRLDHEADPDTLLTWQTDASVLDLNNGETSAHNFNTLGRWTRQLSSRSALEVQAYYDHTFRDDQLRARIRSQIFDITAEHRFGLTEHHDFTWGIGYRHIVNSMASNTPVILDRNTDFDLNLASLYLQDEWRMMDGALTVTTGARLEHNDITGFELQPSLRLLLKPSEKQTLWAAVSRAVRTPSAVEGTNAFAIANGTPFFGPGGVYVPRVVGNDEAVAEVLWAYEMGYRIQPHKRVSVDVAAFYNQYTDLIGVGAVNRLVPGAPAGVAEQPWSNALSANIYGGELSVTVSPSSSWRLTAGYSLLLADFQGPDSAMPENYERAIPTHQVMLRSSYDFSPRLSLDGQMRYVDEVRLVPGYIAADIRLLYRVTDRMDISFVAQNLFANDHMELANQPLTQSSSIPAGFYGKITWRF